MVDSHGWMGLTAIEAAWREGSLGYEALAAGSGTAETSETSAQCEASQSGPNASEGNAQTTPDPYWSKHVK
jgi:hypothetical protein